MGIPADTYDGIVFRRFELSPQRIPGGPRKPGQGFTDDNFILISGLQVATGEQKGLAWFGKNGRRCY